MHSQEWGGSLSGHRPGGEGARAEAEAEARRLAAVLAGKPGLHLLLSADDTYRIIGASDASLRATMTAREAILGRPLFEVFPDPRDDATADGVRNLAASLARVRASGRPERMAVQRHPIRRPAAEGGELRLEQLEGGGDGAGDAG